MADASMLIVKGQVTRDKPCKPAGEVRGNVRRRGLGARKTPTPSRHHIHQRDEHSSHYKGNTSLSEV